MQNKFDKNKIEKISRALLSLPKDRFDRKKIINALSRSKVSRQIKKTENFLESFLTGKLRPDEALKSYYKNYFDTLTPKMAVDFFEAYFALQVNQTESITSLQDLWIFTQKRVSHFMEDLHPEVREKFSHKIIQNILTENPKNEFIHIWQNTSWERSHLENTISLILLSKENRRADIACFIKEKSLYFFEKTRKNFYENDITFKSFTTHLFEQMYQQKEFTICQQILKMMDSRSLEYSNFSLKLRKLSSIESSLKSADLQTPHQFYDVIQRLITKIDEDSSYYLPLLIDVFKRLENDFLRSLKNLNTDSQKQEIEKMCVLLLENIDLEEHVPNFLSLFFKNVIFTPQQSIMPHLWFCTYKYINLRSHVIIKNSKLSLLKSLAHFQFFVNNSAELYDQDFWCFWDEVDEALLEQKTSHSRKGLILWAHSSFEVFEGASQGVRDRKIILLSSLIDKEGIKHFADQIIFSPTLWCYRSIQWFKEYFLSSHQLSCYHIFLENQPSEMAVSNRDLNLLWELGEKFLPHSRLWKLAFVAQSRQVLNPRIQVGLSLINSTKLKQFVLEPSTKLCLEFLQNLLTETEEKMAHTWLNHGFDFLSLLHKEKVVKKGDKISSFAPQNWPKEILKHNSWLDANIWHSSFAHFESIADSKVSFSPQLTQTSETSQWIYIFKMVWHRLGFNIILQERQQMLNFLNTYLATKKGLPFFHLKIKSSSSLEFMRGMNFLKTILQTQNTDDLTDGLITVAATIALLVFPDYDQALIDLKYLTDRLRPIRAFEKLVMSKKFDEYLTYSHLSSLTPTPKEKVFLCAR